MDLYQILCLSAVEIIGDVSLKEYANDKGEIFLLIGILGYVGVVIFLILNLQGSTLLIVNNAWDGTSSLIESLFAYFILGERFEHYSQYLGAFAIILGLFLLKIPLKKSVMN